MAYKEKLSQLEAGLLSSTACGHFSSGFHELRELSLAGMRSLFQANISSSTLTHLDLSKSVLLSVVLQCPNLTHLNLGECSELADMQLHCPELVSVDVHGLARLRNFSLQQCPDLARLNLSNTSLRDGDVLREFSKYGQKVTYLDLSGCTNISDTGRISLVLLTALVLALADNLLPRNPGHLCVSCIWIP